MASPPRLPPELEYLIFLYAYQDDYRNAKDLILVAKRVFDWIIPHVFSIVEITNSQCIPIKLNKLAYQKYGRYTRHLWLGTRDFGKYLYMFPNVVDLVCWEYDPIYISSLLQLPLTRLSTSFGEDLLPVFTRLTHLDISFTIRSSNALSPSEISLPNLTHLCIDTTSMKKDDIETFLGAERYPNLKVVIIWEYGGTGEPVLNTSKPPSVDDPRVVMIHCFARRDWLRGARGGVDMWEFAEGVVEARKSRLGV